MISQKVAIIMSIYASDDLDHLRAAVESIFGQDCAGIVVDLLIFVDGKIPTGHQRYLDTLDQYYPKGQFQVLKSSVNQGLAHALNRLIDHALLTGDYHYIARMDSDDISLPHRIRTQVNFMEKFPLVDISGSFCEEFGSEYALSLKTVPTAHDEIIEFAISRCPMIHPSVIYRTSLLQQGYRYPTNVGLTEDMAFWLYLIDAGAKFANLDQVLIRYRLTAATIKRRLSAKKAVVELVIRLRYMFRLKRVSVKNISLILARLLFHLLPLWVVSRLYRNRAR